MRYIEQLNHIDSHKVLTAQIEKNVEYRFHSPEG